MTTAAHPFTQPHPLGNSFFYFLILFVAPCVVVFCFCIVSFWRTENPSSSLVWTCFLAIHCSCHHQITTLPQHHRKLVISVSRIFSLKSEARSIYQPVAVETNPPKTSVLRFFLRVDSGMCEKIAHPGGFFKQLFVASWWLNQPQLEKYAQVKLVGFIFP